MATEKKTPIHLHEHPAYPWIAVVIASIIIFSLAGWYYLTLQQTNDDQAALDTLKQETVVPLETAKPLNTTEVDKEIQNIDKDFSDVLGADINTLQL
jgi:hypothetical protein